MVMAADQFPAPYSGGAEPDFSAPFALDEGMINGAPGDDPLAQLEAWAELDNAAGEFDEAERSRIADRVIDEFQIDKESRADWEKEARDAMDAVLQRTEAKSHPWEGASNVKFPILTTAVLQFGARTYPAVIQGDRVVRVKRIGQDHDGAKTSRGERVSEYMSYQLLEEQPGWESEFDTMVHQLPVLGHEFRKVYRDPVENINRSDMVSAMVCVVNQATRSIDDVPRLTHMIELYPHQIIERIRDRRFLQFEFSTVGAGEGESATTDSERQAQQDEGRPHLFLEQYRMLDLDNDGFPEPWIATVHKDTGTLVRLQANYDLDRALMNEDGEIAKLPKHQQWVSFPFIPDPNGGFYGIGFGRLLKSIAETIDTSTNQMLDSATLQNKGGGFVGSGLNIKKSTIKVMQNEWTVLNVPGQKIREAIVPHQFHGPSPVLFQLLGLMIDAGKQIASVQDVLSGETSAKTMQPTTLLALIEQGLKVFTAIIKRLFRSLSKEFRLLYALNQRFPDEEAYAEVIDWQPPQELIQQIEQLRQQGQEIPPQALAMLEPPTMANDFATQDRGLVPVADPNSVTDMQALGKAQVIWSALEHPNLNKEKALRRYFGAAKIEDIDDLVVPDEGPSPLQIEDAKAELRKKHSAAARDMATAKKAAVEAKKIEAETGRTQVQTERERQQAAGEYADMASGRVDAEHEVDLALKTAQTHKTLRDAERPPAGQRGNGQANRG